MSDHVNAAGSPSAPGGRASTGKITKDTPPGELAGGSTARPKVRAAFYVDGFNLYHAIDRLRQPHLKWLNLRLVAEALIEQKEEITRIVWCSAEPKDNDKKHRHQNYQAALKSESVEPILGHFKTEDVTFNGCKGRHLGCQAGYTKNTEKGGDVNVAIHMISDAIWDKYDVAYLVSVDTDQVATLEFIAKHLPGKRVVVVAPPGQEHSDKLLSLAYGKRTIRPDLLERCLFGVNVIERGRHVVTRPNRYDPPLGWKRPSKGQSEVVIATGSKPPGRQRMPEVIRKPSKKKLLNLPPQK